MKNQNEAGPGTSLRVPELIIPHEVWVKLMSYIRACPYEINGFGYVSLKNGVFHVEDIFILEQVVTDLSADTVDEALQRHQLYMHNQGIDPTLLRFQWHSHVQMSAYFSTTDQDNISRWPCLRQQGGWLISLVANQRGEYRCQLDMHKPFHLTLPLQPVFAVAPSAEMIAQVQADIMASVKRPGFFRDRPLRKPFDTGAAQVPFLMDPDESQLFGEVATEGRQ